MLESKNMLGKEINHIIEQEKAIKRKGCGLQLKSYIHTPKPQIQGMEPRRGRFGVRTLPCDCGEKRRIKGVQWCLDEFRREIEKLERGEREFAQETTFYFFLVAK